MKRLLISLVLLAAWSSALAFAAAAAKTAAEDAERQLRELPPKPAEATGVGSSPMEPPYRTDY